MSQQFCSGDSNKCHSHFHDEDSKYLARTYPGHLESSSTADASMTAVGSVTRNEAHEVHHAQNPGNEKEEEGEETVFRRIIRNFTPS
jgi:hypothetical protein